VKPKVPGKDCFTEGAMFDWGKRGNGGGLEEKSGRNSGKKSIILKRVEKKKKGPRKKKSKEMIKLGAKRKHPKNDNSLVIPYGKGGKKQGYHQQRERGLRKGLGSGVDHKGEKKKRG